MKKLILSAALLALFAACHKDHHPMPGKHATVTVENVLTALPLVESGTFKGGGDPPVILPGHQVSIRFSAAPGQALSFATMYGWSSDLFFAPENPGLRLYDDQGQPIEGDVSDQLRLWDNGSRINQAPGMSNPHTAAPDPDGVVTEVKGMDAQGFSYLPANQLMRATLSYEGQSVFELTLANISGGTANETPFSPGVWAVSNALGGNLLNPAPLYEAGQKSANGLTPLAEMGDNSGLASWASANTGIMTPLSPVLIVVYRGDNPLFSPGQADEGMGLSDIAQKGDGTALQAALSAREGVRHVYLVAEPKTAVLLPSLGSSAGGSIQQQIDYLPGDRISFATMFGYSNDWFYSFGKEGVEASASGDFSGKVVLWDDGTALSEYPGAGLHQGAFGGNPADAPESGVIDAVGDQYPVPAAKNVVRFSISQ